jgi:hypothetical protein
MRSCVTSEFTWPQKAGKRSQETDSIRRPAARRVIWAAINKPGIHNLRNFHLCVLLRPFAAEKSSLGFDV